MVESREVPRPSGPAFCGDVAQLGERLVRNEEVGGSTPLVSTRSNAGFVDPPSPNVPHLLARG